MESAVNASYQPAYVALSFAISVIGAFVALSATALMRNRQGRLSLTNTLAAGLSLGGIGVWSMHFIGMLALQLDVGSAYSVPETVVSLLAAIAASAAALAYVSAAPQKLARVLGAGFLLGLGVVFMHYLGMFGIRIGGYIRWDWGIVALSAVIAIAAASAALWLAFNTHTVGMRVAAALIMGLAVCAMHYTGMNAAEFVCTVPNRGATPLGVGYLSATSLPKLIITISLGLAVVVAIDQALQRLGQQQALARG